MHVCSSGRGDSSRTRTNNNTKIGTWSRLKTRATLQITCMRCLCPSISYSHSAILIFQCCAPLFFSRPFLNDTFMGHGCWIKHVMYPHLHYVTCAVHSNGQSHPAPNHPKMTKLFAKILQFDAIDSDGSFIFLVSLWKLRIFFAVKNICYFNVCV